MKSSVCIWKISKSLRLDNGKILFCLCLPRFCDDGRAGGEDFVRLRCSAAGAVHDEPAVGVHSEPSSVKSSPSSSSTSSSLIFS
uniref:Uncharacterized protein n=1 Tax=Romanomermis culicivorax TaxID=13658 RepID=A0A915IV75_ROMCU